MSNKVLVHVIVPELDESFDVFVPINIKIGTLVKLLNKSIKELSSGMFEENDTRKLYDSLDSKVYSFNKLVRETNIRSGTNVVLM